MRHRLQEDSRESWPWIIYLDDLTPVNISSPELHDALGYQDEFPLGFGRAVGDLDQRIADHGSLEAFLDSLATTAAVRTTDGSTTPDMYEGPRGSGSATEQDLSDLTDKELRDRAEAAASDTSSSQRVETTRHSRSAVIKRYARNRAEGECEACGEPAPFDTQQGEPYLEVHHLQELSDEGADDPDMVAAIGPNCHRRIHYGADGNEHNQNLATSLGRSL